MAAQMTALNSAFGFSLASMAAYMAGYVFGPERLRKLSVLFLLAAFVSLTAGLAMLWAALGRPPLSNQYESLLALLWFVFPLAFYFRRRTGKDAIIPAAALISCLLFGAAALLDRTARPLMPALRSDWLIVHVLTSMAAYAAFALAAAGSAWALARREEENLSGMLQRLARAGFALLTLGIVTGAVWAESAWGAWWSWDPKETWSLLTWLAYAALLHLKKRGLKDRKFCIMLVTGFALVLFTYFGVNFLLSGLHSYG